MALALTRALRSPTAPEELPRVAAPPDEDMGDLIEGSVKGGSYIE